MPPRNSITRKTRISYLVFALAVEANPGATQEYITEWVRAREQRWLETLGWKTPKDSRSRDYIRGIIRARSWMDSEWHVGVFAANQAHAYDIPADSIPDVLIVALRVFAGGKRLTARQAWWVSRLRQLVPPLENCTDLAIDDIYSLAVSHAANERAAAALSIESGVPGFQIPEVHDSDTWSLDVLLSIEHSALLPVAGLYEVLEEAAFIEEPKWSENIRSAVSPMTENIKPLYELLIEAQPLLLNNSKAMTTALLRLRAYAEQRVEYGLQSGESAFDDITEPSQCYAATKSAPAWDSLSDEDRLNKAKEICMHVMKLIEQQKETDRDN